METIDKSNGKKKGHSNKWPYRRYGYFRDNQIMFLVSHETGELSQALLEQFRTDVNSHLEGLKGGTIEVLPQSFSFPAVTDNLGEERRAELQRFEDLLKQEEEQKRRTELQKLEDTLKAKPEADLTELQKFLLKESYPPSTYRPQPFLNAFSLLVCNLEEAPEDPLTLLINILELRKVLNEHVITTEPQIEEMPEIEIGTMKIEDITPNWVMSVASNGSGTGGPGGLPKPFRGKDDQAAYEFNFIHNLSEFGGEGENVDVVILDTAPCLHDLVLAPKEWPDNRLITGLLGPDGKLTVYPATYEELRRMENASLNRHDYEMSDHGLFAAGIVHSIVPKAKIHLIEVLNQWGIGDLATLAGGLRKASEQIFKSDSGRHLVVNCSWMLDLPLSNLHCSAANSKNPKKEDPEYDFEESILYFSLKEREQASALWALCNRIFLAGGKVVAAAGNDWERSKKPKDDREGSQAGTAGQSQRPRIEAPEARYPAGFVSVAGVGALPKDAKPNPATGNYPASSYSNLGDKPVGDAIMTLGGEEGDKKGVLGLYLGEKFPVEEESDTNKENYKRKFRMVNRNHENYETNSWAWWAGTSFATPILSGTIAAMLSVSGPTPPRDAQRAIQALYEKGLILQAKTDATEDVMAVTQG
jgi:hypothetical protein